MMHEGFRNDQDVIDF